MGSSKFYFFPHPCHSSCNDRSSLNHSLTLVITILFVCLQENQYSLLQKKNNQNTILQENQDNHINQILEIQIEVLKERIMIVEINQIVIVVTMKIINQNMDPRDQ